MSIRSWKYKIDIKQYLTEDDSNEAVVKAATGVVKELKKLPDTLDDILFIISEFEELAEWATDSEKDIGWVDKFNYHLDKLYDWADYERVWLGL